MVVYPEKQVARWTVNRYVSEHVLDYFDLTEDYAIYEVEIPEHWIGKSIALVDVRSKYQINILAIREDKSLNVAMDAHTVLREGQSLLVLGKIENVRKCFKV